MKQDQDKRRMAVEAINTIPAGTEVYDKITGRLMDISEFISKYMKFRSVDSLIDILGNVQ